MGSMGLGWFLFLAIGCLVLFFLAYVFALSGEEERKRPGDGGPPA